MNRAIKILLALFMILVLASCDKLLHSTDTTLNTDQKIESSSESKQESDTEPKPGLAFELREDGYYVVGLFECKFSDLIENGELVIPATYRNKPVVGISDGAFTNVIKHDREYGSGEEGYFTLRLEDGLRSIGKSAFAECPGLHFVTLPSTLTEIDDEAFRDSGIKNIEIPANVTSLGEKAFYDCNRLESVNLSDSLSDLPASVFEKCISLVSVNHTGKLLKIGSNAFQDCTNLENFVFGDQLKTIEDGAFSGCKSLTSVILPDSLTSLGKDAFSSCYAVKELRIGHGINEIPEKAFRAMTSLEKLIIPDHITAIHRHAFDNLTSLTELTIPKSVTYFEYCFNDTYNIENVYYEGTLKDWLNIDFSTVASSPLYYSPALLYLDGVALKGDLIIPNGITTIKDYAFEHYSYITSVSIPYDMEYIGTEAFYGCKRLESVSFAGDVDVFGSQVFYGCQNIDTIDFGNKLSKIGNGMFSQCGDIEKLVIPSNVKVLDHYSFSGCHISELVLSEGIEEIRGSAFDYHTIPTIRLPGTLKSIKDLNLWNVDKIYYNGTAMQWKQVDVILGDKTKCIHCIDGDIYVPTCYE